MTKLTQLAKHTELYVRTRVNKIEKQKEDDIKGLDNCAFIDKMFV